MDVFDGSGGKLYTVECLASLVGVTVGAVHVARSRGQLPEPVGQVGRTLLWAERDVAEWVAVRTDPVPAALRRCARWVVWREIVRHGKPTKLPLRCDTGAVASSTDPGTWGSYRDARACVHPHDGVGFVLNGDGIVGVDLDDCIHDGVLARWAERVVALFPGCYCEVSPSGAGLRLFGTGQLERGRVLRTVEGGHVELYGTGRYLTVTGRRWGSAPSELGDMGPGLAVLLSASA